MTANNGGSLLPFAFDDALVRVFTDEIGNPWFVAKDVCRVLGLENVSKAVSDLEDDEKGITISDTPGGNQSMLTISESGLYSLIFRSRKPEAKRFRKWVTSEVLPAIRKTGSYALGSAKRLAPPSSSAGLRPMLRERILSDALQAARLVGASTREEVRELYDHFCDLVSAGAFVPLTDNSPVRRWAAENLIAAPGTPGIQFKKLYADYCAWHVGNEDGAPNSFKTVAIELAGMFEKHASNKAYYRVRFTPKKERSTRENSRKAV